MSGIGGSEFLLLCMIGIKVLGTERLPRVSSQLGTCLGQARRMTRVMKRQLEEELSVEKNIGINPHELLTPREDDSYSPLHVEEDTSKEKAE